MPASFDSSGEMHRDRFDSDHEALDDFMVDRLLNGEVGENDVPADYTSVVALLKTASASVDIGNSADSVALLAAAVHANNITPRRKRVLGQIITMKVAGIAAGAVFSMGGVAAAATGTLPAPAQNVVSDTVAHVGVDVPKAKSEEIKKLEDIKKPVVIEYPHMPEHVTTTTTSTSRPVAATGEHATESRHETTDGTELKHEGISVSTTTTVRHEEPKSTTSTTVRHEEPKPTTTTTSSTVRHEEPKPTTTTTAPHHEQSLPQSSTTSTTIVHTGEHTN